MRAFYSLIGSTKKHKSRSNVDKDQDKNKDRDRDVQSLSYLSTLESRTATPSPLFPLHQHHPQHQLQQRPPQQQTRESVQPSPARSTLQFLSYDYNHVHNEPGLFEAPRPVPPIPLSSSSASSIITTTTTTTTTTTSVPSPSSSSSPSNSPPPKSASIKRISPRKSGIKHLGYGPHPSSPPPIKKNHGVPVPVPEYPTTVTATGLGLGLAMETASPPSEEGRSVSYSNPPRNVPSTPRSLARRAISVMMTPKEGRDGLRKTSNSNSRNKKSSATVIPNYAELDAEWDPFDSPSSTPPSPRQLHTKPSPPPSASSSSRFALGVRSLLHPSRSSHALRERAQEQEQYQHRHDGHPSFHPDGPDRSRSRSQTRTRQGSISNDSNPNPKPKSEFQIHMPPRRRAQSVGPPPTTADTPSFIASPSELASLPPLPKRPTIGLGLGLGLGFARGHGHGHSSPPPSSTTSTLTSNASPPQRDRAPSLPLLLHGLTPLEVDNNKYSSADFEQRSVTSFSTSTTSPVKSFSSPSHLNWHANASSSSSASSRTSSISHGYGQGPPSASSINIDLPPFDLLPPLFGNSNGNRVAPDLAERLPAPVPLVIDRESKASGKSKMITTKRSMPELDGVWKGFLRDVEEDIAGLFSVDEDELALSLEGASASVSSSSRMLPPPSRTLPLPPPPPQSGPSSSSSSSQSTTPQLRSFPSAVRPATLTVRTASTGLPTLSSISISSANSVAAAPLPTPPFTPIEDVLIRGREPEPLLPLVRMDDDNDGAQSTVQVFNADTDDEMEAESESTTPALRPVSSCTTSSSRTLTTRMRTDSSSLVQRKDKDSEGTPKKSGVYLVPQAPRSSSSLVADSDSASSNKNANANVNGKGNQSPLGTVSNASAPALLQPSATPKGKNIIKSGALLMSRAERTTSIVSLSLFPVPPSHTVNHPRFKSSGPAQDVTVVGKPAVSPMFLPSPPMSATSSDGFNVEAIDFRRERGYGYRYHARHPSSSTTMSSSSTSSVQSRIPVYRSARMPSVSASGRGHGRGHGHSSSTDSSVYATAESTIGHGAGEDEDDDSDGNDENEGVQRSTTMTRTRSQTQTQTQTQTVSTIPHTDNRHLLRVEQPSTNSVMLSREVSIPSEFLELDLPRTPRMRHSSPATTPTHTPMQQPITHLGRGVTGSLRARGHSFEWGYAV